MELQFKRREYPCLEAALQEVRNTELTHEIRLPDGMPDIGHILCAWGQTVLRGKEWRLDSVSCSAGMMVWVLYAPEDGSEVQWLESWVPFQLRWDLPDNCPEGTLRIRCIPRFVDARSVSPRKILVRAGVAAQAEAFVAGAVEAWEPEQNADSVELLKNRWPVQMPVEAGEKTFQMDEEPQLQELPEKIISYRLDPKLTEKRVLGNKLVFRGTGTLHMTCRMADGRIRGMDAEMPFSQFAQLDGEYGSDARADIVLCPSNLELELADDRLRFKAGMVAQYLITDRHMLTTAEDAYSPDRELQLHRETVEVPALLEQRRENIYGEQTISGEAAELADITFLPDFPRQRGSEQGVVLEAPGQFLVLYYTPEGGLAAGTARWEGSQTLHADEHTKFWAVPASAEVVRGSIGGGQIVLSAEVPLDITAVTNQQIPMVTGADLGEIRQKDPERPSLILRRAGEDRLWDIAKACGSTVDAISRINGLSGEPDPKRILLIPTL